MRRFNGFRGTMDSMTMTATMTGMDDWKEIRQRFEKSKHRRQFKFGDAEREYVSSRGMDIIRRHASDFVRKRLRPANPRNDGRQTPTKGHPVFIAQHATATCCRKCLSKVHRIELDRPLTDDEAAFAVNVIVQWIADQMNTPST